MFSTNIVAESKAKGVVDYIIQKEVVTIPDLLSIRINGERLASISTHISDGRKYARSKGYEIQNTTTHKNRTCISTYYAIKCDTKNTIDLIHPNFLDTPKEKGGKCWKNEKESV